MGRAPNRAERWRLEWRDAALRRRLETHAGPLWNIRRWRAPVVVSWQQFALPTALVLGVLIVAVAMSESLLGDTRGLAQARLGHDVCHDDGDVDCPLFALARTAAIGWAPSCCGP